MVEGNETFERDSKKFCESLLSLQQRKKFCDVTLVVDGKRIQANSIVLSASSDYFYNELANEKTVSVLKIDEHYDHETFLSLIKFCYTGIIEISEENVKNIIKISNKLLFQEIIDRGTEMLKNKLSVSNCLSTWKFAISERLGSLEKKALEFAQKNFESIWHQKDFLDLEHLEVYKLLESEFKISEKVLYDAMKKWIDHDSELRKIHLSEFLTKIKLACLPEELLLSESTANCEKNSNCFREYLKAIKHQQSVKSDNCVLKYTTLLAVGEFNYEKSKTIEVYHLTEKEWVEVKALDCKRTRFVSVLLGEELMLIGGRLKDGSADNTVESYNLKTGEIKSLPSMWYKRFRTTAVTFQNTVYVIGGFDTKVVRYVEKWDPEKSTSWSSMAQLLIPRQGCEAKVLGEKIIVIGGHQGNGVFLNDVESYDPSKNEWEICAPMNYRREAPGAAVVGSFLYVIGGWNGSEILKTAEKYDPATNQWSVIQSSGIERWWLGAGNLMGKFIIAGGISKEGVLSTVEEYDEEQNKWKPMVPLTGRREVFNLVEVPWTLAQSIVSRKNSTPNEVKNN